MPERHFAYKEAAMKLSDYWQLSPEEQAAIVAAHPEETEEEQQAFLNVLFPAYNTFDEADAVYDLSDIDSPTNEYPL